MAESPDICERRKRSALISEAIRPSVGECWRRDKANWRPLEPDAGNADAGSEGPKPDCVFSYAIFRAWLEFTTDEHGFSRI